MDTRKTHKVSSFPVAKENVVGKDSIHDRNKKIDTYIHTHNN